jgi:hypothetical protein
MALMVSELEDLEDAHMRLLGKAAKQKAANEVLREIITKSFPQSEHQAVLWMRAYKALRLVDGD